jgi:hypothetical protein
MRWFIPEWIVKDNIHKGYSGVSHGIVSLWNASTKMYDRFTNVQKCPERFGYLADRSSCPDHWKRVIHPALEIVKRAS